MPGPCAEFQPVPVRAAFQPQAVRHMLESGDMAALAHFQHAVRRFPPNRRIAEIGVTRGVVHQHHHQFAVCAFFAVNVALRVEFHADIPRNAGFVHERSVKIRRDVVAARRERAAVDHADRPAVRERIAHDQFPENLPAARADRRLFAKRRHEIGNLRRIRNSRVCRVNHGDFIGQHVGIAHVIHAEFHVGVRARRREIKAEQAELIRVREIFAGDDLFPKHAVAVMVVHV